MDVEKLFSLKADYESEKAELEKKMIFVNAKIEVVDDIIAKANEVVVESETTEEPIVDNEY